MGGDEMKGGMGGGGMEGYGMEEIDAVVSRHTEWIGSSRGEL
jgi:hypothetical protein